MRAWFFRRILAALERHTPALFASFELQLLTDAAARAFNVPGRRVLLLPPEKALQEYCAFTRYCMEKTPAEPKRLYREASRLGRAVRRVTGFTAPADLTRLVFYLYHNLRISMSGQLPGGITVSSCYFAQAYTPAQCRLMSCMDAGVIAGLFGGGRLCFSARLTEGCAACKACFTQRGNLNE